MTSSARRDRRLTPARPDLAAESLRGTVEAARFAPGIRKVVATDVVDLRREPSRDAPLDTQILHGETVLVFEDKEGWSWLQAERDGYVGYALSEALACPGKAATHRVIVNRTFIYPAADMKRAVLGAMPLDAHISVQGFDGGFAHIQQGWLFKAHLSELHRAEGDYVTVAERMIGAPYLWGGKTPGGIDCSGLVQLAMAVVGRAFPRDSDLQAIEGELIANRTALRRGDLVFWKGHVGILRDASTLLHANGHQMLVGSEPLAAAEQRIVADANGSGPPQFRRPITPDDEG